MPPVLVAPSAFPGLRAAQVAGALARGLDAGGWEVEPCPLAGGGAGTLEALLLGLGGETVGAPARDRGGEQRRAGFALLDGGGTAVIEAACAFGAGGGEPLGGAGAGELVLAAVEAEAELIVLAAGGLGGAAEGDAAAEAIGEGGGLRGARLVVLGDDDPDALALAGALRDAHGARVERGPSFVLDALDYDARMRAARCVVVGDARLDDLSLGRGPLAEAATRARQAGVPCHAVVAVNALDRFGARILDLQAILEAGTLGEIEAAGWELAGLI